MSLLDQPLHERFHREPDRQSGDVKRAFYANSVKTKTVEYYPFDLSPDQEYVQLGVRIDPIDYRYDYSKLYWAATANDDFDESRVICFRLRFRGLVERVRLRIPDAARRSRYLKLRLEALPYSSGIVSTTAARIKARDSNLALSRAADLLALKAEVRAAVERSERNQSTHLTHYPESLSLELTAGCNLTCSHCSSHGIQSEHHMNNVRAPFSLDMLERLAHELFPHLTTVNLVGRGEPMMVTPKLWDRLAYLLDTYRVLMICVTNGHFLKKRVSEALMPSIDTITVSVDGTTQDTFGANRGGAKLDYVLDNVAYFHELRQRLPLARRPRLGFSWTLKKNNIHQFPDFIRMVKPFQPSLLYVRHLFVFRNKDQCESLLDEPELVNANLREAYRLIEGTGIKLDVPPLMDGETLQ